jgi:hypothetical protein
MLAPSNIARTLKRKESMTLDIAAHPIF